MIVRKPSVRLLRRVCLHGGVQQHELARTYGAVSTPLRSAETKLTKMIGLKAVAQHCLAGLYDWLDCSDGFCDSDLVFVHAGAKQRKVVSLGLYSQGKVRSLLLSMTPGDTHNFAALKWPVPLEVLEAALSKPAIPQHAFVWLESGNVTVDRVPLRTFGTLSEVCQLNRWLRKHGGFRSVLMISTAPHLRRVRMCCRAILPASISVRLTAIPAYGYWDRNKWWSFGRTRVAVLLELPKLLIYVPLTQLGRWRRWCASDDANSPKSASQTFL